jgi:glycosyltransferase involved in cell wall biosynthesis
MRAPRLAVFNTQPPHLYFGGVERRILETAKRLTNDVSVTIYSGTKGGFTKPVSFKGTRIVPCFTTDALFPLDNWVFNHTISRAINTIKADVYEAHAVSGYGFLKAHKKRKAHAPFIQTVHGVLADEYLQAARSGHLTFREELANVFMWQLARHEAESARTADIVVTVSHYSSRKIVELYGVDEAKVRVVPNGVDPEKFKPTGFHEEVKRRYGFSGRQVVLFVGRLIPRKGLTFLVEAARDVNEEKGDTAFVIVGNGPLKRQLAKRLEEVNLSRNFFFFGDVKDTMLPDFYNCADVFAFPSIQEGQGIALLEAAASAKPVVAFKVGGVEEAVLNGESGLLVERGNHRKLGEAILKLLSNQSLREKMGARGREFVLNNYTWDICAERMLRIYREALSV